MKKLFVSLLLLPTLAFAGAAVQGKITTRQISTRSPAHYVYVQTPATLTVASGTVVRVVAPASGRLVDVIIHHVDVGVGGTSFTPDVKTVGGTSLFTTIPVLTLAGGSNTFTDTKGEIALPGGWTRGVLKTDATVTVNKGDRINVATTETGSYSTHATIQMVFVFDPLM